MITADPRPELPPATVAVADSRYAGLATRALAFAVDAAIVDAVALFVGLVVALGLSLFKIPDDVKVVLAALGGALALLWAVAYFTFFWSTTGQTPGDRVMRLRVLREDGGSLKPIRAMLRLAVAALGLFLFLGYVPILLNDRRRALHDWAAGTVVVNEPPYPGVTVP